MAQYITKIRTDDGDHQIDYNALANLPTIPSKASDIGAQPALGYTPPKDTTGGQVSFSWVTTDAGKAALQVTVGSKVTGNVVVDDPNGWYGGITPIINGGTGATSAATARNNLGITPANIGAAPTSHKHSATDINSGTLPVGRGGTGATTESGFLQSMFPNKAQPTYIPVFGDGWGSRGYALPSDLMTAMGAASSTHKHSASDVNSGTLPIERGGTGATTASRARDNLNLPWFRTYYFESDSALNALKNNYDAMSNGACIVYIRTGMSYVAVVGYKVDNYAAFLELWYGDSSLYK